MCNFRKMVGGSDFPCRFKKIVVRCRKIGYNINLCDGRRAWLLVRSGLAALLVSLTERL